MKKRKSRAAAKAEAFVLAPRITIAEAMELHRSLLVLLSAGGPIVIDGSAVQELDTSALQLLVSLWRTAATRGVTVAWQGVSDKLRKGAALIGVAEHLDLEDGAQPAHA